MPEITVDIGGMSFLSREASIKVDGYAFAAVRSISTDSASAGGSHNFDTALLHQDHWISRARYLKIVLEIAFAQDLNLADRERKSLTAILGESIISAELWAQLGFEVPRNSIKVEYDTELTTIQITMIQLGSIRRCKTQKIGDQQPEHYDLCNFGPPLTVPSYQPTSLRLQFLFSSAVDAPSRRLVKVKRNGNSNPEPFTYVRLADAFLRTLIASKPTRSFGVRILSSRQIYSLSLLLPSTFAPGYAESLADRVKLIEPIARFLYAFKVRNRLEFGPVNEISKEEGDERRVQSSRIQIETDLWSTMANALKNEESARRLKPLQLPVFDTRQLPEDQFEDIAHFHIEKGPETFEDDSLFEGGSSFYDHLCFDSLNLPQSNLSAISDTRNTHQSPANLFEEMLHGHSETATYSMSPWSTAEASVLWDSMPSQTFDVGQAHARLSELRRAQHPEPRLMDVDMLTEQMTEKDCALDSSLEELRTLVDETRLESVEDLGHLTEESPKINRSGEVDAHRWMQADPMDMLM